MNNDKKIGIIGGVGPQSTDFIYEKIIQFSQLKYNAKDNIDVAKEMLINAAKSLSKEESVVQNRIWD